MPETTQTRPDKVRACLATDYRLGHTAEDIILTIGQRSERLAALFAANGVNRGAFLTAYNPRGTIQADAANERGPVSGPGALVHGDCLYKPALFPIQQTSKDTPS
jgi:hypothetical protein